MLLFTLFPRRRHQLEILTAHIKQLEAMIIDLQRLVRPSQPPVPERTVWNGSTNLVPIAPARLRPVRLSQPLELEERQIARVIITPSHKVVSYDQAEIPWLDYCGDLRKVGWKVLQAFKGRWLEVDYEVELPQLVTN